MVCKLGDSVIATGCCGGHAHVACLVKKAKAKERQWVICLCNREYEGAMRLAMATEWNEWNRNRSDNHRAHAHYAYAVSLDVLAGGSDSGHTRADAVRLMRASIAEQQGALGRTHKQTLGTRSRLAEILHAMRRLHEAEEVARTLVSDTSTLSVTLLAAERAAGMRGTGSGASDAVSVMMAQAECVLARILVDRGAFTEARALFYQGMPFHSANATHLISCGASELVSEGRYADALVQAQRAADMARGAFGFMHRFAVDARDVVAHIIAIVADNPRQLCDGCGTVDPGAALRRCGDCRAVRYCGKECQTRKWTSHEPACLRHLLVRLQRRKDTQSGDDLYWTTDWMVRIMLSPRIGMYVEAEAITEKQVSDAREGHGEAHSFVLLASAALAASLARQGRLDSARAIFGDVFARCLTMTVDQEEVRRVVSGITWYALIVAAHEPDKEVAISILRDAMSMQLHFGTRGAMIFALGTAMRSLGSVDDARRAFALTGADGPDEALRFSKSFGLVERRRF
jgi:hypothetical protein